MSECLKSDSGCLTRTIANLIGAILSLSRYGDICDCESTVAKSLSVRQSQSFEGMWGPRRESVILWLRMILKSNMWRLLSFSARKRSSAAESHIILA